MLLLQRRAPDEGVQKDRKECGYSCNEVTWRIAQAHPKDGKRYPRNGWNRTKKSNKRHHEAAQNARIRQQKRERDGDACRDEKTSKYTDDAGSGLLG